MSAEQADQVSAEDQLAEVLAEIVDDYLDGCGSLDEVDSQELGQQLAAAVMARRMPPGITYVSHAVRAAWGH